MEVSVAVLSLLAALGNVGLSVFPGALSVICFLCSAGTSIILLLLFGGWESAMFPLLVLLMFGLVLVSVFHRVYVQGASLYLMLRICLCVPVSIVCQGFTV